MTSRYWTLGSESERPDLVGDWTPIAVSPALLLGKRREPPATFCRIAFEASIADSFRDHAGLVRLVQSGSNPITEMEIFESRVQPSVLVTSAFQYIAGGPHPRSMRNRVLELLRGWEGGFVGARFIMEECERMHLIVEPNQETLETALGELAQLHHQLYLPSDAPLFRQLLADAQPAAVAIAEFERRIEELDVEERTRVLGGDPFYSALR